MRLTIQALLLAFAVIAAPAAHAQDASHCDKLTDDDAFNKCLAASSPARAGARPARAPASAAPETPAAEAPRAETPRRASRNYRSNYGPLRRAQESAARSRSYARTWRVQRVQGGRVRMTIPMSRPSYGRRR